MKRFRLVLAAALAAGTVLVLASCVDILESDNKKILSVIFDPCNGKDPWSPEGEVWTGDILTMPDPGTREGYAFVYWQEQIDSATSRGMTMKPKSQWRANRDIIWLGRWIKLGTEEEEPE